MERELERWCFNSGVLWLRPLLPMMITTLMGLGALCSMLLEFSVPRVVISQHSWKRYMIVDIFQTGMDTRMVDSPRIID